MIAHTNMENVFWDNPHSYSEPSNRIHGLWTVRMLLMFFVYTYFCGAVYDDMVCSKMELALFSVRWIQEFLIVRWLENGKQLSMQDVEQISWWYAREIEHSDDNLNALEDWLFETYAPEGCVLEEE